MCACHVRDSTEEEKNPFGQYKKFQNSIISCVRGNKAHRWWACTWLQFIRWSTTAVQKEEPCPYGRTALHTSETSPDSIHSRECNSDAGTFEWKDESWRGNDLKACTFSLCVISCIRYQRGTNDLEIDSRFKIFRFKIFICHIHDYIENI